MKENNRVAIFVDAENISSKYADRLMEEASNYGDVIIKRVFADWSKSSVQPWRDSVSKHSLIAEQQFSAVKGKNTSDISLIINAMTVLFEKNIDVFCLASSDSDFTRLVQEMRERGKTVVGFGMKQTVQEFINAFSEFIYLDEKIENESTGVEVAEKPKNVNKPLLEGTKMRTLCEIIDRLIEDNGKAFYSQIIKEMKHKYSDFVAKNYGFRSTKEFMQILMKNKYTIMTEADGTTLYVVARAKSHKK